MILFSTIHAQVLNTLKSNTFANMHDYQIEQYLDAVLLRAISDFRYPKIDLSYSQQEVEGETVYVFDNDITQNEINVLLTLMKKHWLEQQLDDESRFQDVYYDRDVKTYSRGNMMKVLTERYELASKAAEKAQYDYSRVTNKKFTYDLMYDE